MNIALPNPLAIFDGFPRARDRLAGFERFFGGLEGLGGLEKRRDEGFGVEGLEIFHLFADADEFDRYTVLVDNP